MALQIKENQDSYDVIIVGSGAGTGVCSVVGSCVGKIVEFPTRKLSSIFIHRFKNAP
jgi:hypothetical protein